MFIFDNILRDKEDILEVMTYVWNGSDSASVETKIRHCRSELTAWTREQHQNSAKVIKYTQAALELALSNVVLDPVTIGQYTAKLEQAYCDEEIF